MISTNNIQLIFVYNDCELCCNFKTTFNTHKSFPRQIYSTVSETFCKECIIVSTDTIVKYAEVLRTLAMYFHSVKETEHSVMLSGQFGCKRKPTNAFTLLL